MYVYRITVYSGVRQGYVLSELRFNNVNTLHTIMIKAMNGYIMGALHGGLKDS